MTNSLANRPAQRLFDRKGTLLITSKRESDLKTASRQLGHASEKITSDHYIQKADVAPDSSALIQAKFGHLRGVTPDE